MTASGGDGPRLNQRVTVLQGSAGVVYVIPVSDRDGNRPDLSQATAKWWAGALPVARPGQPGAYVAGSPTAYSKDLSIVPDGVGGYQVVLPVDPADIASFCPGGLWQHEVWITDQAGKVEPVTIGPLVVLGTVKGVAPADLRALTLDSTSAVAGTPFSATIGNAAAGSTITATADDGSALAVIGSTLTGTFLTVGAKVVTLTESLEAAAGSPNATLIVLQVNPRGPTGSALITVPVTIGQDGQTVIPYPAQQPPALLSTVCLVVNGGEYRSPDISIGPAAVTWANPDFGLERSDEVYLVYT